MNTLLSFFLSYLINSLWDVPLLAAAAWLVTRLLRRADPHTQHRIWLAALVLAILTPALPNLHWLSALVHLAGGASDHPARAFLALQPGHLRTLTGPVLSAAATRILCCAYALNLLFCATRLVLSLGRTASLLRNSSALYLDPHSRQLWSACRQSFQLPAISLLHSNRVAGPATLGLRHTVIILPNEFFAHCTPHDILTALAHECAHIERHDFQKNLLYEAAGLVIAWHPATWFLHARIAQTRELLCDRIAVKRLNDLQSGAPADLRLDPKTYAQSLLRLAAMTIAPPRSLPSLAIGIFDADILETRIMAMTAPKQSLNPFLKWTLLLPGSCFLLAVAASAAAVNVQAASSPQQSANASPYGPVYPPGKDVSNPKLIFSLDPEFPKSAHVGKKFSGDSVIGIIVDRHGAAQDVHVIRSLTPAFDAEAMKAVRQYRFHPATKAGQPVAVAIQIEVHFERF